MGKIKQFLSNFYYSFAVQLLLLSFKKHQFLLLLWVFLFALLTGQIGAEFGVNSLLLDPEYLDNIGYLSFAITGAAFGAVYISWNLAWYLLHCHRFKFLASFNSPMGVFFINNSTIPFAFLVVYIYRIISFQKLDQFANTRSITLDIVGFMLGLIFVLILTAAYFQFTNKNALRLKEEISKSKNRFFRRRITLNEELEQHAAVKVDYFINHRLAIRHTREVDHYADGMHQIVFKKHHWNSMISEFIVLFVLIGIGFGMEYAVFQIPTAASLFLFVSIIISIFGAIIYWVGGWGTTTIISLLVLINLFSASEISNFQSRAYGLDYSTKATYSLESLKQLSSTQNINHDIQHFIPILNKWLAKNTSKTDENKKPPMVFINVSGGGMRSAMFTTAVLQEIFKLTNNQIFDKTCMISGASGGMFGATYLRDLFLDKKLGLDINMCDSSYLKNISKDLLNPMCIAMLSNDAFFPIHKFQFDSMTYHKDRGFMMEEKVGINTLGKFEKRISDYKKYEMDCKIPLMIYHTSIVNDSRRYFISAQPVSFLMRPVGKYITNKDLEIDGIDFTAFFKNQKSNRLKVSSAVRMNATFPFILPNACLPSDPPTYVMDGGIIDNFGAETTIRFIQTFKDWIKENTSGVVIIQIRDNQKNKEIERIEKRSWLGQIMAPLGSVFANMENMQDFGIEQKLGFLSEDLKGKIQMITFEYIPEKEAEKAALSFHLTEREKNNIRQALYRPNNQKAFKLLQESLK